MRSKVNDCKKRKSDIEICLCECVLRWLKADDGLYLLELNEFFLKKSNLFWKFSCLVLSSFTEKHFVFFYFVGLFLYQKLLWWWEMIHVLLIDLITLESNSAHRQWEQPAVKCLMQFTADKRAKAAKITRLDLKIPRDSFCRLRDSWLSEFIEFLLFYCHFADSCWCLAWSVVYCHTRSWDGDHFVQYLILVVVFLFVLDQL